MEKFKIGQKIISGFPGTGKSSYCNTESGYMPSNFASDSDSSKFDKLFFPDNYISHIKEEMKEGYARIFVSSHKEVRDALVEHDIHFTLVYPDKNLKEDYIKRYKNRGSSESFIKLVESNWDIWLDELSLQKGCTHVVLQKGEFMSNKF